MRGTATRARTKMMAFPIWLVASAGACTSWQTQEVPPEQLIAERHPSEVRVTLQDGRQQDLSAPFMLGDTLAGTAGSTEKGPRAEGNSAAFGQQGTSGADTGVRVLIPTTDLVRIQTNHVSAGKTAGLVIGMAVVVAGLLAAAETHGNWNIGP